MNRRFWIRFAPSKTPSALNLGCGEGDDRPGMWIKLLVSAEKQGLTYVIHIPGRSDTFLATSGGRYAKFAKDVNPNELLAEALTSAGAKFLPNGAKEGSFIVIADIGRVVGTKGQTAVCHHAKAPPHA